MEGGRPARSPFRAWLCPGRTILGGNCFPAKCFKNCGGTGHRGWAGEQAEGATDQNLLPPPSLRIGGESDLSKWEKADVLVTLFTPQGCLSNAASFTEPCLSSSKPERTAPPRPPPPNAEGLPYGRYPYPPWERVLYKGSPGPGPSAFFMKEAPARVPWVCRQESWRPLLPSSSLPASRRS